MAGEDADWPVLVAVSEPPKLKPQDALPATKHGKQWGSCHRGTLVAPSLARLGPRNVAAFVAEFFPRRHLRRLLLTSLNCKRCDQHSCGETSSCC